MQVSDYTHYTTDQRVSQPYRLAARCYYTQDEVDSIIANNPDFAKRLLKVTGYQIPEIEKLIIDAKTKN